MGNANNRDRAAVSLNQDDGAIEHGPGIAHPRTEHGAVRGCLMMSMVPGVLNGLNLCQPADGQDTEHKNNRENL